MKILGAYKLTHVASGLFYIGHTCDFKTRKGRHLSDLNCGRSCISRMRDVYVEGDDLEWVLYPTLNRDGALALERHLTMVSKSSPLICNKFNAGYALSDEHRSILVEHATGRTMLDDTKSKISIANTGRSHTDESKAKISSSLSGYKHNDTSRVNMTKGKADNPLSQEMRDKIAKCRMKSVTLDGVTYPSVNDAALALGVSRQVIYYRTRSLA